MKFSPEQIQEMQSKLASADTHQDIIDIAKEYGEDISVEDIKSFAESFQSMDGDETDELQPMSREDLDSISGGANSDIPQYDIIREYYKQKGPNPAFILCIYYIPSPICYEIIQVIEKECPYEPQS